MVFSFLGHTHSPHAQKHPHADRCASGLAWPDGQPPPPPATSRQRILPPSSLSSHLNRSRRHQPAAVRTAVPAAVLSYPTAAPAAGLSFPTAALAASSSFLTSPQTQSSLPDFCAFNQISPVSRRSALLRSLHTPMLHSNTVFRLFLAEHAAAKHCIYAF